jgi:Ras-related protein Rab-21
MQTHKICVVGSGGSGKTALVKALITKNFEPKYIRTLGCEVEVFRDENYCFNLWDCAGSPQFIGLDEGYYVASKACILVCDLSSEFSFNNLDFWINKFWGKCPEATIIICGTKCDFMNEGNDEKLMNFGRMRNHPVLICSSKHGFGLQNLIEYLKTL